ncbi:hypothetical protein [Rhodospirillum centenum]|uniref:Transglycosylase SLT domain-containing protein n=1 Tax=Rhodospirillum centenum (strain ATCC 51521 / SW) TaxID=414684 RepID=B6IND6_RHOCS|nr:hypothetical protein [Rhodospirillum centenum]ACI99033.1 conserved hypothetical protein [Rhodospirillum centenum SW]
MTSTLSIARPGELQSGSRPAQSGASVRVLAAVQQASARTGVDFSYLMEKAAVESGYRTDVKARTSSATGLYQFVDRTWLDMVEQHGAKHGLGRYASAVRRDASGDPYVADPALKQEILDLRKDPKVSALLAGELANDNRRSLEADLDRPVDNTDLYLAHFLGAGGAGKFLSAMEKDPSQPAAKLLPEAARANRSVFYDENGQARSLQQIYDRFDRRFGGGTQVASDSVFGTRLAEDTTSQPWLSSRSTGSAREPISTFTVMQLSALLPPTTDGEKGTRGGAGRNGDGNEDEENRRTPNVLAGAVPA